MKKYFSGLVILFVAHVSALVNGTALTDSPDVVQLRFTNGWVCSGVFLNPNTILTAAHCLQIEGTKSLNKLSGVYSTSDLPLPVLTLTSYVHPEYADALFHTHDVGIIKVSANPHFQGEFTLADTAPSFTGKAELFGCGRTGEESLNATARLTGMNRYYAINDIYYFFGASKDSDTKQGYNVSIAPHDSGGPMTMAGTKKIIALMTTTMLEKTKSWHLPTLNTGTSTTESSNKAFIESHLKD